jgi:hypothetical protein
MLPKRTSENQKHFECHETWHWDKICKIARGALEDIGRNVEKMSKAREVEKVLNKFKEKRLPVWL